MPDTREVFDTPDLPLRDLLAVLVALSPQFADARSADLRIGLVGEDRFRLLLPHWNALPRRDEATVRAVRAAVAEAVASGAKQSYTPERRATRSIDFSAAIEMVEASALAMLRSTEDRTTSLPISGLLAVVPAATDRAELVAGVIRRSRHVSVLAAEQDDDRLAVLRVEDDPETGSTLQGLRAAWGGEPELLAVIETPGGDLWLPRRLVLPRDLRPLAGKVLRALREAGWLSETEALLVWRDTRGVLFVCSLPSAEDPVPSSEALADGVELTPLALRRLALRPTEEARRVLAEMIADRRFPIGYRIELKSLPDRLAGEPDIEQLRERIAEIEAEIGLIQAMSAPQMRLLRFTDAQLPALVDGLRRMPPAMLKNPAITFATGHAGGRPGPAHFVLYDPAQVSMEGRLPEYYWRRETEDHPIGYWLDPHASAALTGAVGEPLIFVPERHRIIPAVDSFGGTLAQTLRLVLGGLFAETAGLMDDPNEQPLVIFSPPTEAGFAMDVELLGRRGFAPLQVAIRWINDHMLVRSPRLVSPSDLTRLADDLYEGEVARNLRAGVQRDREELEATWTAAADALSDRMAQLLDALTQEVGQVRDRAVLARGFLEAARGRIAEIDMTVAQVNRLLEDAEKGAEEMRSLPLSESDRRYAFVGELLAELESGETLLRDAEDRIQKQRTRIEDTYARLRAW